MHECGGQFWWKARVSEWWPWSSGWRGRQSGRCWSILCRRGTGDKPIRRPKLGPWQGVIDAILADDKQRPRKQRHTAKRIFGRLKAEHGYTGGYTIVKDYVRESKLGSQEMFVPLTHAPGEAQADFGEAQVVIAGVEQTAHYQAFDPPHSDDCFVQAFPAETTEAFLEGHVRAFAYWGAVPSRIL